MQPEKVEISHVRSMTNSYGDVWATAWADDDLLYTVSDDTHGFDDACNSNLAISVLSGERAEDLHGRTVNPMNEYGACNEEGPDGATWKANGLTCVEGVLYLSVSRHRYGKWPYFIQYAWDARIVKSEDHGQSWSPEASLDDPMFPGRSFGTPFFVQYGKDGTGGAHGGESYLYAVSNDGSWNNGTSLVMGRVRRDLLARLDVRSWEYLAGFGEAYKPVWTPRLELATAIFRSPGRTGMTGIQYVPQLSQYLLPQWYYLDSAYPQREDWHGYVMTLPTMLEIYASGRPRAVDVATR